MDEKTLIAARFHHVRRDLEEVVGRLNDELLPWAPLEGMRTVAGQLVEIAATEFQVISRLRGEPEISFSEAEDAVGDRTSLAHLVSQLRRAREETLTYLATADLAGRAPIPLEWNESMGLPEVPIGEVLRSIAEHEAYHTGQLVSYMWSRGDDPYTW